MAYETEVMGEALFMDVVADWLCLVPEEGLSLRTPDECGVDSLSAIELVMHLEELGVLLPDDLRWDVVTFGELYQLYILQMLDRAPL